MFNRITDVGVMVYYCFVEQLFSSNCGSLLVYKDVDVWRRVEKN